MLEYKYEEVRTGGSVFSGCGDHRSILDRCAQEGWEYVGFLPTSFTGHGGISSVDLIFKREVPEK